MSKKFTLADFGYEVEIGKFANQTDGAVWFKQGGTVLLASVVTADSKEFPGFLPLMVEYRELFSAAGKIPGGYFKREGRASEHEILTSRLIDRALRPLFPSNYFNKIQVLVTVYSVDKEYPPENLALFATSLALSVSGTPFLGPVGSMEIGRIDGQWVVAPSYEQSKKSDVRIVVGGTQEGICMVEGSVNELSNKDFLDALFLAHDYIKKQVAWQKEIQSAIGKPTEKVNDFYDVKVWQERISKYLTSDRVSSIFIKDKIERKEKMDSLKKDFLALYEEEVKNDENLSAYVLYYLEETLQKLLTDTIIKDKKRIDGRNFEEVRNITTEVGLLPNTHGSSLFTRGGTQALASVTLGGGQDEQRIEGLLDEELTKSFMLHYNFLPISVGEARPMRAPSRREFGHGRLASSALKYMLPSKESFPYTIRIVADMLASDGSTSMATTCSATMALLNTGVPLKKMVSGIAMGLLRSQDGEFAVLTDISGFEDKFGLMDFKVTGTDDGITAIQMDIKSKTGLPREVFEKALAQANTGRLHILNEMRKVMSQPNKELSKLVPKVTTLQISTDKIGAVIGSGGKMIREIIEKTKTTIDIDDNGTVKVFATPESNIDYAINWIKILAGQIEVNSVHNGVVRRIVDFGIFVELVPGQDGLLHISAFPRDKQNTLARDYKAGDEIQVKVISYDKETGRIRLGLKK